MAATGTVGLVRTATEFRRWWSDRQRAGRFEVIRVPFTDLAPWSFHQDTGNLRHASGRFFTIEGIRVEVGGTPIRAQPIINQPEIGVLGLLVREIDEVLHCLLQAKMEPGNINTLQLSPTVQATRSNYTQVHRGDRTRYLEYFIGDDLGETIVDVNQSEQGTWYWRKRNRNIVVLIDREVPLTDDYRWLPISLVYQLLRVDHLVNMDTRTVLACLPMSESTTAPNTLDATRAAAELLDASYFNGTPRASPTSRHGLSEIMSWLIDAKTRCEWDTRLVPLCDVPTWRRTDDEITDGDRGHFRVIGIRATAGNREVTTWTQPLLAPRGHGLAVFVTKRFNGVPHLLVAARSEIGLLDMVEMGPTVHLQPGEDASSLDHPLLKRVAMAEIGRLRYDAMLSEEGGRFHHAVTRYRVIEIDDELPVDFPENFCWLTIRQLMTLLRHGHYVNIEARTLLACTHVLS